MHDAYEQRAMDLDEIRAALEMPEQTVGVAVYRGDRFLGLDLFDRAATFAHYWKSLIDSYALDWLALDAADDDTPADGPTLVFGELIETLTGAGWERYDAPGEGSDLRCEDDTLTASALVWGDGDDVLHLQAFPKTSRDVRSPQPSPQRSIQRSLERAVERLTQAEWNLDELSRELDAERRKRRKKT